MKYAALLATLATAACNQASGSAEPPPFIATAVGRIDSANESRRLVAEVDGVINSVLVERGQLVTAGQTLVTIACGPRTLDVEIAQAAAIEARARAETVRSGARPEEILAAKNEILAAEADERDRAQQNDQGQALLQQGFMSKREADSRANMLSASRARLAEARARFALIQNGSRKSDIAAANAASKAAEAQLGRARAMRDQCELKSPIDGRVLTILKREGEATDAATAQPVMIVGAADRLIIRAEVDERDAHLIHPGQRVDFWVTNEKRWHGRVTELAGVMGRRTARSLDPTDRFDRDVRETFITIDGTLPPALIGLRVTVGFKR